MKKSKDLLNCMSPVVSNVCNFQNCYKTFSTPVPILDMEKSDPKTKTYFELQSSQFEDPNTGVIGIQEKLVEVAYPITAEYVDSYLPDTVYKKDLNNSVQNTSLQYADLTAVQEMLEKDLSESIKHYESTINKLKEIQNKQTESVEKEKDGESNEV